MICAKSDPNRYQTSYTDGVHVGIAGTTAEKGGTHSGFRPHDLLEAALAACISMTLRMYADRHEIPLQTVMTKVDLDRSNPDRTIFRYDLEIDGDLTAAQRDKLFAVASTCPVSKTLSRDVEFLRCTLASKN
jgi:putative redox protein